MTLVHDHVLYSYYLRKGSIFIYMRLRLGLKALLIFEKPFFPDPKTLKFISPRFPNLPILWPAMAILRVGFFGAK